MLPILYPLTAVVIWSFNSIVNKLTVGVIEPSVIAFFRWLLAFIVLTPITLPIVIHQKNLIKAHFWQYAILGLLGMALFQALAYYAANYITAAFMGIANAIIPILTILLSIVLLKVKPGVNQLFGCFFSFTGLIILITQGHPSKLLAQVNLSQLLILLAALCYALYSVLLKYWALPLNDFAALYLQIIFALLFLTPGFICAKQHTITTDNIGLILFAGIPASIIAPYMWIKSIRRLGANTTSIFLNLAPIFTMLFAVILLHEQLTLTFIIGACFVLAGVLMAQSL